MFCSKCGNKLQADECYCSDCGALVMQNKSTDEEQESQQTDALAQTAVATAATVPDNAQGPQPNKFWLQIKAWKWLPIGALALVVLGLSGYVIYDVAVTNGAKQDLQQGETLALQGKYQEAVAQLQAGLRILPHDQVLQADLQFVQVAEAVQAKLNSAADKSKQQDYYQALADISAANSLAKQNQGGLFDLLQKQVSAEQMQVVVAQIKNEIPNKNTIGELAPLLDQLSAYNGTEAQETDRQIREKIADIAYGEANNLLQQNQFADALNEVKQGLTYDANNSKLLSFQDTINKQETEFEQAEKQRIEQAMVEQAKEDAQNKTQSVQVIGITGTESKFGDYVVQGQVQNVGTKPIGMITVYYTVYDANNNQVYTGSTEVYPNYLAQGDTGSFSDTAFGVTKAQRVVVTKSTWYVE